MSEIDKMNEKNVELDRETFNIWNYLEASVEVIEVLQKGNWFSRWEQNNGKHIVEKYGEDLINKVIAEPDVWKLGFERHGYSNWYGSYYKQCTREIALEICCANPYQMKYFSASADSYGKDKTFVLDVLEGANSISSKFLGELSTDLKKDRDVVLAAVKKDGSNYLSSSKANAIRNDIEIIKAAVTSEPSIIREIPIQFKVKKEIALLAVSNQGRALQHIEVFQDDKEVVMAAVKNDGDALQFATQRLINDEEVCLAAIKNKSSAIVYVGEKFKADLNFCLKVIESDSHKRTFLGDCDINIRCDKSFVQMAIEANPYNYQYASYQIQTDRDVYEPLVTVDGSSNFKLLPYDLRNSVDVFALALESAKKAFELNENQEVYVDTRATILEHAGADVQKIILEPQQVSDTFKGPANFSLEKAYEQCGQRIWQQNWTGNEPNKESQDVAEHKLNSFLLSKRLASELVAKDGQEQSKPKRMKI